MSEVFSILLSNSLLASFVLLLLSTVHPSWSYILLCSLLTDCSFHSSCLHTHLHSVFCAPSPPLCHPLTPVLLSPPFLCHCESAFSSFFLHFFLSPHAAPYFLPYLFHLSLCSLRSAAVLLPTHDTVSHAPCLLVLLFFFLLTSSFSSFLPPSCRYCIIQSAIWNGLCCPWVTLLSLRSMEHHSGL